MNMDRREFTALGLGGLAVTADLLSPQGVMAQGTRQAGTSPWYHGIKRLGQTNFNERDPEFGDVEAWANFWASAKVQAVVLSVSGPVAFYPTKVPFFHISTYLNGRDLFGECVTAAKKRGMRVVGRMSPDIQYIDPALLAAHPTWFRRDKKGELQRAAPEIAYTCQFSGQFTEQQPAILNELVSQYDIDGVYMNGWPTLQDCYCETCRKIGDPKSEMYKTALMDRAAEMTDLYRGIITRKKPDAFYSCNIAGGMQDSELDQWKLTRKALWYTSDNQARRELDQPVWQASQQVKYARSLMGTRPVAAVTGSYARSGRVMWRQAANMSMEPLTRMAQTAAAGGIVWYHHLGLEQGFKGDRRWQAPGRDFLSWQAANEPHFHNVHSLARVAIVLPTQTMSYGSDPMGQTTDHMDGFYAALIDARIMSDFLHENELTPAKMDAYDLLILPNFAWMSDAQAQALEKYVQRGGSLLATFQTGLYDQAGRPRPDFALGRMFGIQKAGEVPIFEKAVRGRYTQVGLQMIRCRGPLTQGFEDSEWIAAPGQMQPIRPVADAPLTYINPYPVYPPEAVYQREAPSDRPSVVLRESGRSRLAYLAGDMDASYWRLDNPDLGQQLVNAIAWQLEGRNPLSITGEGLMEVIGWKTRPGYALHLLNYNGPNAFRGQMRTMVALGPQKVRWTLPDATPIRGAKLLHAGKSVPFQQSGRTVELTVPKVDLYEVVALEV